MPLASHSASMLSRAFWLSLIHPTARRIRPSAPSGWAMWTLQETIEQFPFRHGGKHGNVFGSVEQGQQAQQRGAERRLHRIDRNADAKGISVAKLRHGRGNIGQQGRFENQRHRNIGPAVIGIQYLADQRQIKCADEVMRGIVA